MNYLYAFSDGSGGPATHNPIRKEIQIMIQTAGAAVIIYDAGGWRRVLAAESSRSFAVAALACHAQRRG